MIARKIRPGEFKRCRQLCALAFEYEMWDPELSPQAMLDKVRGDPRSMQDLHWDSQYAAFADDDATMLATMTVVPWTANFDGHAVAMGGIGGVASLSPAPAGRRDPGLLRCGVAGHVCGRHAAVIPLSLFHFFLSEIRL